MGGLSSTSALFLRGRYFYYEVSQVLLIAVGSPVGGGITGRPGVFRCSGRGVDGLGVLVVDCVVDPVLLSGLVIVFVTV